MFFAFVRGRSVEFTLSIPNAIELIADYSSRPGLVIGAGTILTVAQAEAVVDAGAHFIVCPCLEIEVVKWCKENNVVCMAGVYRYASANNFRSLSSLLTASPSLSCTSPSEMWAAHKAGAHVAKLFPGAMAGPGFGSFSHADYSVTPPSHFNHQPCAHSIRYVQTPQLPYS